MPVQTTSIFSELGRRVRSLRSSPGQCDKQNVKVINANNNKLDKGPVALTGEIPLSADSIALAFADSPPKGKQTSKSPSSGERQGRSKVRRKVSRTASLKSRKAKELMSCTAPARSRSCTPERNVNLRVKVKDGSTVEQTYLCTTASNYIRFPRGGNTTPQTVANGDRTMEEPVYATIDSDYAQIELPYHSDDDENEDKINSQAQQPKQGFWSLGRFSLRKKKPTTEAKRKSNNYTESTSPRRSSHAGVALSKVEPEKTKKKPRRPGSGDTVRTGGANLTPSVQRAYYPSPPIPRCHTVSEGVKPALPPRGARDRLPTPPSCGDPNMLATRVELVYNSMRSRAQPKSNEHSPASSTTSSVKDLEDSPTGPVRLKVVPTKSQSKQPSPPLGSRAAGIPPPESGVSLVKVLRLDKHLTNKWISGVAVTKKNELIVVDLRSAYLFDEEGQLKKMIGAKGSHRLQEPIDVAVMPNGNLVFSDHAEQDIKIFNWKGQFLRKVKDRSLPNIAGVAVNDKREIFIAGTDKQRISVHSEEDELLYTIPKGKDTKSPFEHPYSVAINPLTGDVIVGDDYKQLVTAFSQPEGKVLWRFCPSGDRHRHFFPSSICVDNDGYVFIADLYNEKVYMLDSSGKFIKVLLSRGEGLKGGPGAIATDGRGHLIVADEEKTLKIFKYGENGFALYRRFSYCPAAF